jgi:hypothetical protein
MILLPGDPLYEFTLSNPPPLSPMEIDNGEIYFVADAHSGILRSVSWPQLQEYLNGGEYEDRLKAIGDDGME